MKILTIMDALADDVRLRIINLLLNKELCVCEIEKILNMSEPRISRHLHILRDAQLVYCQRVEKWCYYHINQLDNPLFQVLNSYFITEKIYKDDLKKLKNSKKLCRI